MQVICTMSTVLSEYPLLPDHALHMAEEALWVEGVGWLGQYHSYLDTCWEKGLPYFVRDVYFQELQLLLDKGETSTRVKSLIASINLLNSKIKAYEARCQQQVSHL